MKNLTLIPFDLPGKIYRCPLPNGSFDYGSTTLQEMKTNRVKKVITLVEEFEWWQRAGIDLPCIYEDHGIEMLHLPVVDFDIPNDRDAYLTEVQKVLSWASDGDNIAVHCFAGIGRTGTFLSTWRYCALAGIHWTQYYGFGNSSLVLSKTKCSSNL
jgi:hypothetical protein